MTETPLHHSPSPSTGPTGYLRGTPVRRREDDALLRGRGVFVNSRHLPNSAVVTYVTSTVAHGSVLSVDVDAAREQPGVIDIVTAADLDGLGTYPLGSPLFNKAMGRPLLASNKVRFVGEPIVAIVAETATAAADAAEYVIIDYDVLPAVVDPAEALSGEVRLFDNTSNVVCEMGDADLVADFSQCDVVVSLAIVNNRIQPTPLEPRTAAALWDSGRLIHYNAGQGVHPVRDLLARIYGLEPSQLRVIVGDVGGSFGAKARPHPEEVLLGHLSRRIGRPVTWFPNRTQDMTGLVHGRGQVQHVTIGGSRDGRVLAYSTHVIQDSGAYPMGGAGLPGNTKVMLTGCYDIASVGFRATSVATNTTPTGAYRGAGRPEAAAAIERAIDAFAAEIGADPAQVRSVNFHSPDAFPLTTKTGTPYDSGRYQAALDMALEAADRDQLLRRQADLRSSGAHQALGIGIATYVERTAGVAGSEFGAVELLSDGRLLARTGSSPYGQGHYTAWSMLISDQTGVPLDDITVVHGDTDIVPRGGTTGGSRSVQLAGSAIWEASAELVAMAKQHAADLLEAAPEDIDLDTTSGRFHVVGTPARSVGWADIGTRLSNSVDSADRGPRLLHAETDYTSGGSTFPFGAHVAVVLVDLDTGQVTLERMIAVDDAGIILNPLLASGQVHGGLAQGIAQALTEEVHFDSDGNPLTANLGDYGAISATELPLFDRIVMETPTPNNILGAKGIGESGTIGATPAIHNAVVDALSHLGVRHIGLPVTAQRVWQAIRGAEGGDSGI